MKKQTKPLSLSQITQKMGGIERMCLKKRKFSTQRDATTRAEELLREEGIELKVYQCPSCFYFHLASKD
jgi:hypothetical protein